jgi:hypothetical protein
MDDAELLATIDKMTWIFARSYERFAPHWYARRADSDYGDYVRLFEAIQASERIERFGKRKYRYLYLGDWKYWTMSTDFRQCAIINRAKV